MKNRLWPVLIAGALAAAQARPVNKGTSATESPRSFREKARLELDDLDRKIDALEADAVREGALVRRRLNADVRVLRADEKDAARALDKLSAAGASAGRDARERVEKSLRRLRKAYDKAIGEPKR